MSQRMTCALSGLPVDSAVYWVLLMQPHYENVWAHRYWTPRHLPITGKYDEYGQIDAVERGPLFDIVEDGLKRDRAGDLPDWWEELYADTLSVKNNVPRLTTPEGLPEAVRRTFRVRQAFIRQDIWAAWRQLSFDGIAPLSNYRTDVREALVWLRHKSQRKELDPLAFQLWNANIRERWPLASALSLELDSQVLGSMKVASHLVLLVKSVLDELIVERAADFCRICDIMQRLGRFWRPSEQVSDDVAWVLQGQINEVTSRVLARRR